MSLDPFKVFMDLQLGLPRNGPGSDASTARAYELAPRPEGKEGVEVLVLGCGAGAEVLTLLDFPETRLTAIDMIKPFIKELEQRADAKGNVSGRLRTICEDFEHLSVPKGIFDLIWCEASIYSIGFAQALALWKPYLKPTGAIVVSEAIWLTQTPSREAAEFWDRMYPEMKTLEGTKERAQQVGFTVEKSFTLSKQEWWTDYYTPLRIRMRKRLADLLGQGIEALAVIRDFEEEIELYETHGNEYGYAFFILSQAKDVV